MRNRLSILPVVSLLPFSAFGFTAPANPFCALTNQVAGSAPSPEMRLDVAKKLHLGMIRTLIAEVPLSTTDRARPYWKTLRESGLKTVQTFGNRAEGARTSSPPKDLKAYATELEKAISFLKPTLVVIENEESAPKFYAGTPAEYLAQLEASVAVAHRLGYPVTNGGITMNALIPSMLEDYAARGEDAKARSLFARVAIDVPILTRKGWPGIRTLPRYMERLAVGRALLEGYRRSSIDYVNFHWYTRDASTFAEAARYIAAKTGKRAMTHEFGTRDRSPATVKALLDQAKALGLAYACYYDGDGPIAYGLHDPAGNLRPNGEAFAEWMRGHPFRDRADVR